MTAAATCKSQLIANKARPTKDSGAYELVTDLQGNMSDIMDPPPPGYPSTSSADTSDVSTSSGGDRPAGVGPVRMRRDINLCYSTAIMTGIVIGSGIFVSPTAIAANCGSIALALIFWIVPGFINLALALCYTELGCAFPRAGGEYAFFIEILGPLPAFLDVWVQYLTINPSFLAILALTTVDYLFYPLYPHCDMPDSARKLISITILGTYGNGLGMVGGGWGW